MVATLTLQNASSEGKRLSDSVYETMLDAIISGKLKPGTVVSEVALARQLQVSRTPVHDALRQLAKDGLVQQRANHRAVIAEFTAADIHDLYQMRKLLEGEAARLAANGMDRATLAHLRETADMLAQNRDKSNWTELWADFDEEFHNAIAKASGSPRLWQDIARYHLLHRGFNKLSTTPEGLEHALKEHVRILDALEKRDPKEAQRAMVDHLKEWQVYFVNHFPKKKSQD
jgi:DNA-binding GntR family transcriptional regulator